MARPRAIEGSPAAQFASLLRYHMQVGTRPAGKHGTGAWSVKALARAIGDISPRTVENYRNGSTLPADILPLINAFFGDDPRHVNSTAVFVAAFNQARGLSAVDVSPHDDHGRIPRPTEHFLGREKDVATILNVLLASSTSIAALVQGGPGMGKTTLTAAVARRPEIIQRFGETNRWFVPLDTATTTDTLHSAIAGAIGSDPALGFRGALAQLRANPGLLVLDNLETPWEPIGQRRGTVDMLAELDAISGLAILASFRGRDIVRGPAWALIHPITELDRPNSADLFCRVAQRDFSGDPYLDKFVEALGGIPLAIELVAGRAGGETPLAGVWDQWTRYGTEFAINPDFDGDRLSSLPRSIELSLQSSRMNDDAWGLFRLLGQLPAGIGPDDRDILIGKTEFDAAHRLARIGLAVERNGRLDLLPPIREHAARFHPPWGAPKWPEHYLALCADVADKFTTNRGSEVTRRILAELPNIEAALRVTTERMELPLAVKAIRSFGMTIINTGVGSIAPIEALAERCRENSDIGGEANSRTWIGHVAHFRGDTVTARYQFKAARELYHELGNARGEAQCIQRLGDIAHVLSEYGVARKYFEDALAIYKKEGSIRGEAWCEYQLGDIAIRPKDFEAARQSLNYSLQLYRSIPDLLGEANCVKAIGEIELRRLNFNEAQAAYDEARRLYQQTGDELGETNLHSRYGDLARARGDEESARMHYRRALEGYDRMHEPISAGWIHLQLARTANSHDIVRHLDAARVAWTKSGDRALVARLEDPGSIDDLDW